MNRVLIFAAALVVSLASCTKKGDDKPTPPKPSTNTLTGVNKWIREQLEEWYYWRDALVASTAPSNSLAYDEFLEKSLSGLTDAIDEDGTVDGHLNADGSRRLYSYIERFAAGSRAEFNKSLEVSYGMGVRVVPFGDTSPTIYGVLVSWVTPAGPADKAGVKRGMIFDKYNGEYLHEADVTPFLEQLYYSYSTAEIALTEEPKSAGQQGTVYTIAGASTRLDPVLAKEVITTAGGKKVAYLMYNSFRSGDQPEEGAFGEFDIELRNVFGEFKAAGATELVLDFRYNGGGYLKSSQLLSSLAGKVTAADVFCKMYYNNHIPYLNPETMPFLVEPNSLGLTKVYVLTSYSTASASEELINGLRGVDVEVVTLGETTNGKNTGMIGLFHTEGAYRYALWPITFKSCNAKGFSEYSAGFEPTVELDELAALYVYPRGELYGFGDPRERLLDAALTMIDGGTVAPDTRTRTMDDTRFDVPADPRVAGTRVRLEDIGR